jgi:hypothetical protein
MPVKQGSGIKKSGRVFGLGQENAKTTRAASMPVSLPRISRP